MNIHAENQLRYKTPQEISDDISMIIFASVGSFATYKLKLLFPETEFEDIDSSIRDEVFETIYQEMIHSIQKKFIDESYIELDILMNYIRQWEPEFVNELQTIEQTLH
jgi:hypothetical protein